MVNSISSNKVKLHHEGLAARRYHLYKFAPLSADLFPTSSCEAGAAVRHILAQHVGTRHHMPQQEGAQGFLVTEQLNEGVLGNLIASCIGRSKYSERSLSIQGVQQTSLL